MSKSNMLLGLAKGKVGDLVFYRDGGEQRTRTRVIPKNPRTFAQQAQRVKIANVSGIFRAAADILRDSFVNRPSNQSGFNAFASRAITNAPYITKEMATAGVVIPQPAMASKGTLAPVVFSLGASTDFDGPFIDVTITTTETTTVGEVAAAVLAQNPWLVEQAELHFVLIIFDVDPNSGLDIDYYTINELHSVFKLDPTSSELLSSTGFEVANNSLRVADMTSGSSNPITMAVVMQSLVDGNGRLDVSSQYFALSGAASSLYDGYRTEAALQQAVESYNASEEISLR